MADNEYPKTVASVFYKFTIGPPVDRAVALSHMELGGRILVLATDAIHTVRTAGMPLDDMPGTTLHMVLSSAPEATGRNLDHLSDAQRYAAGYGRSQGKGSASFIAAVANLAKKAGRS